MIDYKRTQKELYLPKATPSVVDVPEMAFIMVDGRGNPNSAESYHTAIEILYGLSYAIKMSKKGGCEPEGYFDYAVPPLEGLWWLADDSAHSDNPDSPDDSAYLDKDKYCWTAMIRQPEFVTQDVFGAAKTALAKKKPKLDPARARLELFTEGLCAQVMHIGPYDDEPATIAMLHRFISDSGYHEDISETRRHHEIYLSNPLKTAPEKCKTVLRYPVK